MEDISDATSVATSQPEEAAKNISNANLFSIDPRYAAQNKSIFDQKADQLLKPQEAEAPVATYMRQSSEHTALATPDVDKLSWMAKQSKMISDYVFDRPTTERQIVDLNLKKMNNGGKLEGDDEIKLMSANQDAQDQSTRNYGLNGPLDSIPAFIAGGISDLGQSMVRGARKGIMEGPFSNLRHPISGTLMNAAYGTAIKDPFDTISAGMYNELSNMTGPDGQPKNLDHDTKLAYSRGVGIVGTALMNAAGMAVAQATPFLKPFVNPVLAKGFIDTPAKAAIITALGNTIKGSAALGGASGLTEVAKVLAEEMGKNKDTDEAGFWNALSTASTKANASRVASATGQGAALGALLEVPLQIAGYGVTKQHFESGFDQYLRNRPETRDVTPEALKQLPGATSGAPPDIDITPQIGGDGGAPNEIEKSYKALQLNEALHNINDVQKSTKMNDIAPGELGEVNKENFAAAGMTKFYSTFGALRDWATSDEKGLAARKLIDPSGVAAGQMNAPFELKSHDVMEIAKTYPDILDHMQYEPDGPTGMQAKEHVEALNRAEEQRTQLMSQLGIKPEEVESDAHKEMVANWRAGIRQRLGFENPGATVTSIGSKGKAEEIPYSIETDARRTQELLDQKKEIEKDLADLEQRREAKKAEKGNVTNINSEVEDPFALEKIYKASKNHAEMVLPSIDKELAEIKERVTGAMKQNPPGSVLAFPFNEQKAADNAEMRFGHEPTFTEALQKVLPEEQVAKFNDAVLQSRQHVVNAVRDEAAHEMNRVIDQTAQLAREDARRGELERIAHDPNYAIVEKFHTHQIANSKGKNKRSFYAIDPATLPPELKHYYEEPKPKKKEAKSGEITNPYEITYPSNLGDTLYPSVGDKQTVPSVVAQLKAHKIWAPGGNSLEDSARALGFANGKDLLDLLAKTPTRAQIQKARSEFYDSHIDNMARAGVELDHTSIMKAFTDKTKAYLEGMKYLKDTDWTQTKFGLKKIALPLPRMEDIEHDARVTVKDMKVGSLTPAQFVVGERQSYRMAVNKFLNGDLAGAFQAKEMAARNTAIQKEVRKAIAEVNRAQKFFRRLEDPAAVEVMRTAGKVANFAMDQIVDNFNFNPKRKGQSEQDSYNKWIRREVEQGRGDFSIPDRLSDVRKSINEMTVEQVRVAYDRAKTIFKEAQYKSELIENKELREEERNVDRIAEMVQELAGNHPESSPDNFKDTQGNETSFQGARTWLQETNVAFSNMEHSLRFYDQGQMNGFMQSTFMHQLKGDGKFDGKMGFSKEHKMMVKFADTAIKIMDNHGEYHKVERTRLNIPEFKDVPSLSNGQLTKGDLMVAWAYKGDPQGREKLQNNFLDSNGKAIALETWQKVFDRELTKADVTAMQYSVDMYKGYQDETRDLQQRTKGEDVTFIKGVGNLWRDKDGTEHWFPGGYVPNKHITDFTADAAKRTVQMLEGKRAAFFESKDGAEYGRQYAAESTEQGRLNEREGTDKPLDLSLLRFWRGHEEVIHDLSYREATMNALKLLRDKRIRESMIQMGGEARYNLVVNTVIEVAGRAQMMNANYFSDQNRFFKGAFAHLQHRFNIVALGINSTSALVQFEELTQVIQNAGPKGLKHFAQVNAKMMATPHLWGAYAQWASELDPTIGAWFSNVQNKITSTVHDLIPLKSNTPHLDPLRATGKWLTHQMFAPMSIADGYDKIVNAMASYSQFMAGDSDNWPIEKVQALSEKERHEQAQAYVRQMSRLSLMHGRPEDKAPSQKHPLMDFFSTYWNFFRNVLNNQISQGNKTKWALKAGNSVLGEGGGGAGGGGFHVGGQGTASEGAPGGKGGDALGYFGTAAGVVALTALASALGRFYVSKLHNEKDTPDQWNVDLKSPKGIMEAGERMGGYLLMSPMEQIVNAQPILRNMVYAANAPDKTIRGYVDRMKTVELPITKQMSDVATAANLIREGAQQANNLSDFVSYLTNLSDKETKVLLNAEAVVGIPFPVNAYSKLMRYLELPLNEPQQVAPAVLDQLNNNLKGFFKKQANPDNKIDIDPKFHAQLEQIQKDIQPEVATIPDKMTDTMKYAMSDADWSKPNGIYGFTKDQWKQVQIMAPDLGLTAAGRISKDTGQQEKAMDWFLHEASQELAKNNIKVDKSSLYGSFRLGADKYEALYNAPKDAKLKTILGNDVLEKNPDFTQYKTVGQLKAHLNNEVNKAAAKVQPPTANLTQPTAEAED